MSYLLLEAGVSESGRAGVCALAVMAKAPRVGKVKTRLAPALGLEGSAAINVCFLRDTARNIAEVSGALAGGDVVSPTHDDETVMDGPPEARNIAEVSGALAGGDVVSPTHRDETAMDGPPEIGGAGLDGPPELDVSGLDGPPELGVSGLDGPPELGVSGVDGPPELGVSGVDGPPELGVPGVKRLPRAVGMVCYTPVGDEAAFDGILPEGFALIAQRGDAFGERLLAAAEDILGCGFGAVCLIDSDSPTLPAVALRQAVEELARPGDRVVLGGSDDGGYYLIGLKRAHAEPFERITWSTGSVYAETVERCAEAGLEVVELPVWYDVDDAETLAVLERELLEGVRPGFAAVDGYDARATREFLRGRRAAVEEA
jgi:glycosyltransferase A (GT-A) superfamily protein (DUF2064 family)